MIFLWGKRSRKDDERILKPVYSVWLIVNNVPKALQYSRYEVCLAGASSRTEESKGYSAKKKARFDAAVRNLPEDCELGVEYVYFYDSHNVTIQMVVRDSLE